MKIRSILTVLLLILLMTPFASGQEVPAGNLEEQTFQTGIDAYIYAYPLVIMDATRQKVTNTPSIDAKIPGADAPANQFSHTKRLADAKMMANWLPAPKGIFDIMLRIYWPEKIALDGSWVPPSVKKIQ